MLAITSGPAAVMKRARHDRKKKPEVREDFRLECITEGLVTLYRQLPFFTAYFNFHART
jgi:hypothetical protein